MAAPLTFPAGETATPPDHGPLVHPAPLASDGRFTGTEAAMAAIARRDRASRADPNGDAARAEEPKLPVDGRHRPLPLPAVTSGTMPEPRIDAGDMTVATSRQEITAYRIAPRRRSFVGVSFILFVLVPTAIVSYYFAAVAKKDYTSEFRFSIIEQTTALPSASQTPTNSMSGGSAASTIATVTSALSGSGAQGNGPVQNFMVVDYVQSPGAVEALQQKIDIAALLHKGNDPITRFQSDPSPEQLYAEWQRVVTAYYDPITSLAFVKIRAFSAADSLLIANTLMKLSEDLVNKIANRANADAVKFATEEVARARQRVADAANAMKDYRNGDQVIDPTTMAVGPNVALLTVLRQNVSTLETQVDSLLGQNFTPTSPTVKYYTAQLNAARSQLQQVEREVKSSRNGKTALSTVVGTYESLDLARQYANLAYTNSMLALDQTRANAAAQHIYLTPYSQPTLPRSPSGPNVVQTTLIAFCAIAFAWVILLMIFRSVREARI